LSSFEAGAHCIHYPAFLGEFARLELGVDHLAIQRYFEAATAARDELEVLDPLFVGGQELGRQTDGLRFVVSHRAVFQFHVHGISLFKRSVAACRLGVW
jgi:hypothetical protein